MTTTVTPLGADVEGGQVGAVGDDPVQPGVGAAPLLAGLPDDLDQPGSGEPFDEVGDRGPGEAGHRLELGGRQRALAPGAVRRASRSLMARAVLGDAGMAGILPESRRPS